VGGLLRVEVTYQKQDDRLHELGDDQNRVVDDFFHIDAVPAKDDELESEEQDQNGRLHFDQDTNPRRLPVQPDVQEEQVGSHNGVDAAQPHYYRIPRAVQIVVVLNASLHLVVALRNLEVALVLNRCERSGIRDICGHFKFI